MDKQIIKNSFFPAKTVRHAPDDCQSTETKKSVDSTLWMYLRTQKKGEDTLQALKLSFNCNFLIKTKKFGQTLLGRCTFAH